MASPMSTISLRHSSSISRALPALLNTNLLLTQKSIKISYIVKKKKKKKKKKKDINAQARVVVNIQVTAAFLDR
jgi:hypothetical protein